MTMKSLVCTFLIGLVAACCMGIMAQETAASLYNAGLEKAKAKEYAEALSLMEQAIGAAGDDDAKVVNLAKKNASKVAYALGFKHRKAEQYSEALEMHQKGIDYNPGYYSNYAGKAQVLEAMGKDVEAVEAYIKAGDIALKAGEDEKAGSYYNKASNFVANAAIDDQWDKTINLGTAFFETGRKDADVYYYFGRAQAAKGDNNGALESVNNALELGDPDDMSKYYMFKGGVCAALGQNAEAIKAYEHVKNPDYAERAKYEIEQLQN